MVRDFWGGKEQALTSTMLFLFKDGLFSFSPPPHSLSLKPVAGNYSEAGLVSQQKEPKARSAILQHYGLSTAVN